MHMSYCELKPHTLLTFVSPIISGQPVFRLEKMARFTAEHHTFNDRRQHIGMQMHGGYSK